MTRDTDNVDVADIEQLFDGAVLLGGELDEQYRVLGVTLELTKSALARISETLPMAKDGRIQMLCHPISTIIASLRIPDERRVMTFETQALSDVMATVAGATLVQPVLGGAEPRPGTWGPQFSMLGQSNAPDGRSQRATFSVVTADAEFDLFVRFDVLEFRTADGDVVLTHPVGALRDAFGGE